MIVWLIMANILGYLEADITDLVPARQKIAKKHVNLSTHRRG